MAGSPVSRHLSGCLANLVLFGVLSVVHLRLLEPVADPSVGRPLAFVSAFFLALGLSSFWHLARGYGSGERSREALFRRARTGEPPEDGQAMIATGSVRPLGAALVAPISGVPCVSYQYRMYYTVSHGDEQREVPVYWGYASRAFAIDTPASRVAVLAVPFLRHEAETRQGKEAIERARRRVETTPFEAVKPHTLAAMGTAFAMARDVFTDEDGEAGRDWKREGDERDPGSLILEESLLPVDADASVHGTWSARQRAIVAQRSKAGDMAVSVVLGPPEALSAHVALHSFRAYLLSAIVTTALGVGIVWFALKGLPDLP